jgi:glycosyltransferase involved in cell wall biosynthesis
MKTLTSQQISDFVSKPSFDHNTLLRKNSAYPRISIVTPSFNQAEFLERTILSVLNQNYPNLEYIIIDAGSKDNSVEIIRRYEGLLAFWVSEKDNGHADALNKGFRKASGEIFAWLNSDDLYAPDALHRVALRFKDRKNADVVYGNLYRISPNDQIVSETRLAPFSARGYLYGGCDLPQPSTFWRKDLFFSVGELKLDYVFSMDTDLFYRFVLAGGQFEFLRDFVACFRLHASSKTSTLSHIEKADNEKIRSMYLPHAYDSPLASAIRTVAKLRRVMHYVVQGDLPWLLNRMGRRVLKSG